MFHVVLYQPGIPPNTGKVMQPCSLRSSVLPNVTGAAPIPARATRLYTEMEYQENDALLFGPETRGLSQTLLDSLPEDRMLRLPLQPGNRSSNLSNAVAVAVYEARWQRTNRGQTLRFPLK